MLDKLDKLLKKQCTYIEINLKNSDSWSIRQPNQNSKNTIEILDDDIIKWTQIYDDGCTYENYIDSKDISFITGIYNCPSLLEEDENDIEEDDTGV